MQGWSRILRGLRHHSMCRTGKKDVISPARPPFRPPSRIPRRAPSTSSSGDVIANSATTNTSWSNRDSRASSSSRQSLASLRESLPENPQIYSFQEICRATNNFLAKTIGRSPTWQCSVGGHDAVVVRRQFRSTSDELRVRLRSTCAAHHGNVVKLHGATVSGAQIYLVYEYVRGVSLADCLRNPRNPGFTVLKTWTSRMQVASDVAQGLEYIHHYMGESRVHGHMKSSGIIIADPSLTAKITHFGAAELSGEATAGASRSPQRINGTKGYMAPEYLECGTISPKSDVYSFGVVLLELLSGEEPVKYRFDRSGKDYVRVSLVDTARKAVEGAEEGRIRRWVDRRLGDSFPVDVAERTVRLALDCVHDDPNRRPEMRYVAAKISDLLMKSKAWEEKTKPPLEISVTVGPR
ncbi:lysM domain receptor-like kinase 3 [Nymphaea colorata]|uniref:lysM domain receptor-like kinase 3 n=1 Tax=Nymphaea colorata TaxID=210225 RepID=UPI00129DEA65|nr:lysM domain receptor-like kinase 3 [Nymphaea colorata]